MESAVATARSRSGMSEISTALEDLEYGCGWFHLYFQNPLITGELVGSVSINVFGVPRESFVGNLQNGRSVF